MSTSCYCNELRKASRRLTAVYDEALAPAGVNLAQYSLLRNIGRKAPVSLTELGQITELDRSTVGRNARVLERMGLVAFSSGEDQRETMLSLTAHGLDTLTIGQAAVGRCPGPDRGLASAPTAARNCGSCSRPSRTSLFSPNCGYLPFIPRPACSTRNVS